METGRFVLRNLNFQQALAFFAAVECGSFARAAEKLYTSQAAVSRMIGRLEQETGLILFVRKSRESIPTPAGRLLYREWKAAVRQMEDAHQAAWEMQKGLVRQLRIGCVEMKQSLSYHVALLDYFEKRHPEYMVQLECRRTENIVERMLTGELDLVILNAFEGRHLETLGVQVRPLFQAECAVFLHPSHPLYGKPEIGLEDFAGYDFTLFGSEYILAAPVLQDFCRSAGLTFRNLYMESDFGQAAVSFVRKTGLFLSEGVFEEGQLGEARRLPLPAFQAGLVLAWDRGEMREPVRVMRRFAEEIRQKKLTNLEGKQHGTRNEK